MSLCISPTAFFNGDIKSAVSMSLKSSKIYKTLENDGTWFQISFLMKFTEKIIEPKAFRDLAKKKNKPLTSTDILVVNPYYSSKKCFIPDIYDRTNDNDEKEMNIF